MNRPFALLFATSLATTLAAGCALDSGGTAEQEGFGGEDSTSVGDGVVPGDDSFVVDSATGEDTAVDTTVVEDTSVEDTGAPDTSVEDTGTPDTGTPRHARHRHARHRHARHRHARHGPGRHPGRHGRAGDRHQDRSVRRGHARLGALGP